MSLKVDCLAIAAHRDDLEITSGGLIAKLIDLGYRVAMLDLTAGEMGSQGDAAIRDQEARDAAKVLGVTIRDNLNLPDAYLQADLPTRAAVAQKIRDFQPQLVILPHDYQRHPDHNTCSRVGFDACFYAGLKKAKLSGAPHRPRKILFSIYYSQLEPTFAVDITGQFDRKLESVRCYKSQFKENDATNKVFSPGIDVFEMMRVRDRALGMRLRVGHAEGYIQRELLAIDDPLKLAGYSI